MFDMQITVRKEELLDRLEENRAKHRTVFEDALVGYAQRVQEILEEHLASLREGKTPEIRIIVARPEDHTRDYDRVIGMLKMHQDDMFILDEQTYSQYVDDDWSWKRQWLTMATDYAKASVAATYT